MRGLFLILIITALFAASCNKKHCWGCRIVLYNEFDSAYRDTAICDKTREEIAGIRRGRYSGEEYGYLYMEVEQCGKH